jgi:hypothetical protein
LRLSGSPRPYIADIGDRGNVRIFRLNKVVTNLNRKNLSKEFFGGISLGNICTAKL